MRRMTPEEQASVQDWEVRQGAFDDPIHLDIGVTDALLYAIGGVVACVLSSFFPWGVA